MDSEPIIKTGDLVKVWPVADPTREATGKTTIISSNQRSIAVLFDDKPPFVSGERGFLVCAEGVVVLFMRDQPSGFWFELIAFDPYRIQKL